MATTKSGEPIPKTSVMIWRPLIEKLDDKIKAACLRRDAYLRKVLEVELPRLDREVSIPNSRESRAYIEERLNELPRKLVSLALPAELTRRVNEICKRKLIVRDAFFNRLFFLLAAPPDAVDQLLCDPTWNWRGKIWSEHGYDEHFFENAFYPLERDIDPFLGLRTAMELYVELCADDFEPKDYTDRASGKVIRVLHNGPEGVQPVPSIYTKVFDLKLNSGAELVGLSCYMPDSRIPGHPAQKRIRARLDELLADLKKPS